jgi:hypothetical protein
VSQPKTVHYASAFFGILCTPQDADYIVDKWIPLLKDKIIALTPEDQLPEIKKSLEIQSVWKGNFKNLLTTKDQSDAIKSIMRVKEADRYAKNSVQKNMSVFYRIVEKNYDSLSKGSRKAGALGDLIYDHLGARRYQVTKELTRNNVIIELKNLSCKYQCSGSTSLPNSQTFTVDYYLFYYKEILSRDQISCQKTEEHYQNVPQDLDLLDFARIAHDIKKWKKEKQKSLAPTEF